MFKPEPSGLFRVNGEYLDSLLNRLRLNLPDKPKGRDRASAFSPLDVSDLLKEPLEQMPWIVPGYLGRGILTLLAGPPKSGKSTLAYYLIKSIANGEDFLGRPITNGKVLLLGLEEHRRDITTRLRYLGSEDLNGKVKVDFGPLPFTERVLNEIVSHIKAEGIDLVVVDTVHAWWGLDDENSAGEVLRIGGILLNTVRQTQAAWLCLAHTRKSGGEHGQEIRGSSAILGLVDVALSLKRTESGDPQRCIEAVSRYSDTPRKLIISLEDENYQVLGEPADVGAAAKTEKVKVALREDSGQTSEELAGATGLSRRDVDRALERLGNAVVREGTGRKGNAFRYRLNSSMATPQPRGCSLPETNWKGVNGV